jgi:hypothetical protein
LLPWLCAWHALLLLSIALLWLHAWLAHTVLLAHAWLAHAWLLPWVALLLWLLTRKA